LGLRFDKLLSFGKPFHPGLALEQDSGSLSSGHRPAFSDSFMMPVVAPAQLPVSTMGIPFWALNFSSTATKTCRALKVPCQAG
jgi:hypothetical protein